MNRLFFVFLFFIFGKYAHSQSIPPRPDFYTPVIDQVSILSKEEFNSLTEILNKYEDSTTTQIQIVIIDSLRGFSETDYANKWANEWGIGQKGSDNGLLIFIAISDRKIRLEIGYGLEDKITDADAAEIINSIIKPSFKSAFYYLGLKDAINEITKYLEGHYNRGNRNRETQRLYPEKPRYKLGYEGWFNLICMLIALIFFNYQAYKNSKKTQSNLKKTILTVFFIFGNLLIAIYTIFYGLEVDPEKPDIVFHLLVAVFPSVIVNYIEVWFKTIKSALIRLSVFMLLWSFSTFITTYLVDDRIKDFATFIPYVLMGLYLTIFMYLFYQFLINLKNSSFSSSSGSSSEYNGSHSSSSKSSGHKSSSSGSSSKSSYGGGKFGGGGSSGSW